MAVWVALRALEVEPFTEVIVPAVTDPGAVMPVVLNNCIPVPADCAPAPGSSPGSSNATGSYNVGPAEVEARITPRTSAIIAAHISGLPCDMDGIVAVARKHKLPVIEDCAQAHGATYKGRPVGTFGDLATFSTMFGKHHATGGQGGVVYVPTEEMYWRVRRHADRGKPFNLPGATGNVVAALNCNMDELHAAIGRAQLKKLPGVLAARRRVAGAIAQGCRKSLQAVRVMEALPGCEGAYWFLFLRVDLGRLKADKGKFVDALVAEGLPFEKTYYCVPCQHPWAKERKVFGTSGYPWTSPLYKGDPNRPYDLPNIKTTDDCHVRLMIHENCGPPEVADALGALAKVEAAYLK
jgi:dTDP-4-amino-4,6-dideoxygalactose transaminase